MARQHRLAARRDADDHVLVAHGQAEADFPSGLENRHGLLLGERLHRAVGKRPETRRDEGPVDLFAEERHVHPAVVAGHEEGSLQVGGDHEGSVAAQPVRLRKRPGDHHAEVLPAVRVRADPDQRLARQLREDHPALPIIARARDTDHAAKLYKVGVTDAVPEALEASLQLSEAVLVDIGVAMGPVIASIHEKRSELRAEIMEAGQLEVEPSLGRRRLRDAATPQG